MKLEKGTLCRDLLVEKIKPELSYNEKNDFRTWEDKIKEKFIFLTGLDDIEKNGALVEPQFDIEREEQKDGYRQIRFTFVSEPGKVVPCYLLIPDTHKEKYPVVITLQGHSTGFHNSIGEARYPEDEKNFPRNAFALQAVKEGYAALAIQLRGMFGEGEAENERFRRVQIDARIGHCYYESITATLLGRTILGERCWDIKRAIDMLSNFKECDTDKIVITGNSGGGTASYYAACYDKRIKVCMPSSSCFSSNDVALSRKSFVRCPDIRAVSSKKVLSALRMSCAVHPHHCRHKICSGVSLLSMVCGSFVG